MQDETDDSKIGAVLSCVEWMEVTELCSLVETSPNSEPHVSIETDVVSIKAKVNALALSRCRTGPR